ncbi:retrovirus-related Pol polyprotein from transposon 412 [Trichonephila clavipes]|nr:retrovirus-related Pol polyprotein from transposon 412 [Trichonephila clavipes]
MAEIELDCVFGHVITKAAVLRDSLDQGKYLLGNKTAALFEEIFSRMGFPRELQTDQGTSFMSALTTEFLEKFGVKVVRSSVYHPQSNPVERMHRTLKRILRVLCLEAIPDWEKILPQALFALRTVIHDSTGFFHQLN